MLFFGQQMPVVEADVIEIEDLEMVLKKVGIEHEVMKDGLLDLMKCFGRSEGDLGPLFGVEVSGEHLSNHNVGFFSDCKLLRSIFQKRRIH